MLYVPVNVTRFVAGAAERGADAIILDLEDAVAPAEKERARTLLAEAVPLVSRRGADVVVRVNRPWRLLVRDLEIAVIPGVAALALPKTDSAEHVQAVAETVAELEAERGVTEPVGLIAMVETPGAFFRMESARSPTTKIRRRSAPWCAARAGWGFWGRPASIRRRCRC
jgi:citrate lyase subunit beta/citryl-CoA lyase